MERQLYFCADLGTSSLKAALIDSNGTQHGFVRIPFSNEYADSWLSAFNQAVEQIAGVHLSQASGSGSQKLIPASALVISGSGPTLVPVKNKNPVTAESMRPLYWYDPVSPLDSPSFFLPKVKAFAEAQPDRINVVEFFFSSQEWLSWKLGANPVTVLPHDAYIPYYWDDDSLSRFGINSGLFPPFVKMGSIIGELNATVLSKENHSDKESPVAKLLPRGIPIIAGASDFIMSLIGTGTLEPGAACDRTGSSEGINCCLADYPQHIADSRVSGDGLRILPHAISGLWNLGAIIPKSGKLFDEYRSANGLEQKPHGCLVREILEDHTHPGRAVLETMGLAFANAIAKVESCGQPVHELVLSGGQCADPLWNQYKADISGRVLKVPEIIHAELAGNAVLCETALKGGNLKDNTKKMIRINNFFAPKAFSKI